MGGGVIAIPNPRDKRPVGKKKAIPFFQVIWRTRVLELRDLHFCRTGLFQLTKSYNGHAVYNVHQIIVQYISAFQSFPFDKQNMYSHHVVSWKFPLFSILLSFKGFNLMDSSLVMEGWKTHIGVVSEFSNPPLQEKRGKGGSRMYTRIKRIPTRLPSWNYVYFLEPVLLNKKLSCYPNKATGEALSFDLGYHHIIVDRFSWSHEKPSGIVWIPIRYVTLHLRDQRGAVSLRHRNRAATTVLVCESKPCPVWFSWLRKIIITLQYGRLR